MHHPNEKTDDLQPVIAVIQRSRLRKMVEKARLLHKLDKALKPLLAEAFAPHCHVMNLNENTLIIGVDSAAIATRLQFLAPDLMKALRKNTGIKSVFKMECRITP